MLATTRQDGGLRGQVVLVTGVLRVGSHGDVNRLILYLLEGTNFVTGACFRVDRGRFLGEAE
jgi:pteridine reductase